MFCSEWERFAVTLVGHPIYINVQQNILPRSMEWLRDATNASEQDDFRLNDGLNNSFLNYNTCYFS